MIEVRCPECRCDFAIPNTLYECAGRSENVKFYCPYGHILGFGLEERKVIMDWLQHKHEAQYDMPEGIEDIMGAQDMQAESEYQMGSNIDNVIKLVVDNKDEESVTDESG